MQCPLLVLQCWQIIRRKATVRKVGDLHPGVQLVRPRAVSSHRARGAQRVHPWRLPWRPHAYRAALRVSPASKFSERYPSFPPNFTTFGHFLSATDDHLDCFNQTFLCPFMQKNLGPLESGTESKKKRLFRLAKLIAFLRKRKHLSLGPKLSDYPLKVS